MTKQLYYLIAIIFVTLFSSCNKDKKEKDNQKGEKFTYNEVVPAEFPSLNIEGFNFPEDSTTINNWVKTSKLDSIYLHGWGIWTGLTSFTSQKIEGESTALRVF